MRDGSPIFWRRAGSQFIAAEPVSAYIGVSSQPLPGLVRLPLPSPTALLRLGVVNLHLNEHLLHLGERPSRVSDHIRMAVAGELRHQLALPRDTKLLVENMLFAYLDRGTTEIELTRRVLLGISVRSLRQKIRLYKNWGEALPDPQRDATYQMITT